MTDETRPGSNDTMPKIDQPANELSEAQPKQNGFMRQVKSVLGLAPSQENLVANVGIDEAVVREDLPKGRIEMIERVIAFDKKRVLDVMAPRADINAVDIETSMKELMKEFVEAGHSRMPVFRGDLDNPVGMVHIKDVMAQLAGPTTSDGEDELVLKKIGRDLLYVPPSMRITDLLLRMQASRIHMALVIDEFGGTDGLVTIEDLVEEVVGEINDEHDDDDALPSIMTRKGGGWEADARLELDDFTAETGFHIQREIDEEEVDTLGGLVFSIAGRVPQRGEVLSHKCGLDFEVMEADARKIRKVLIRRQSLPETQSSTLEI